MKYKSLDFAGFEFRLLTILEPRDDRDITIRCIITQGNLIDPPEYSALSYCWGDPAITERIFVNDEPVQVTVNLHEALDALRSRKFRLVWVDALCINQNDLLERGLQVTRMGLIYSKAKEVLAWLGRINAAPDATTLFTIGGKDRSTGIKAFFELPYWRRVWILQEISKGPNVKILFGPFTMSWDEMTKVLPAEKFDFIHDIKVFRERERSGNRIGLLQALISSRRSLATDPRDKIYALLDLTSDGTELVPTPNYTQPIEAVYSDLTKSLLRKRDNIPCLLLAKRGSDMSRISPSWAPDWKNLNGDLAPWIVETAKYLELLGYTHLPRQPIVVGPGLTISGYVHDIVDGLASCFYRPRYSLDASHRLVQATSRSNLPGKAQWHSAPASLRAQWIMEKVCTALNLQSFDGDYPYLLVMASKGLLLDEAEPEMNIWFAENEELLIQRRTLKEWVEEYEKTGAFKRKARKGFWQSEASWKSNQLHLGNCQATLLKMVKEAMRYGQRLAVLEREDGNILYLVCKEAQKGDHIAVLEDCRLPVVLRSYQDGYVLIGETGRKINPTDERLRRNEGIMRILHSGTGEPSDEMKEKRQKRLTLY
jgi:Heterokaryon incompatibility protein (HET)